jgi:hypothetical protein
MNDTITDRQVIAVVRVLDKAAEFNRRAKACPRQHSRGLYRRKDLALQEALTLGPGQFYVDSIEQSASAMVGVTHKFSARRFHIRRDLMPREIQDALAETPASEQAGDGAFRGEQAGK